MLHHLLINLYNARWPEEFNSGGFCLPEEDAPPVQDPKEIESMFFVNQVMMAEALVEENEAIKGHSFYYHWILPIETWLKVHHQKKAAHNQRLNK